MSETVHNYLPFLIFKNVTSWDLKKRWWGKQDSAPPCKVWASFPFHPLHKAHWPVEMHALLKGKGGKRFSCSKLRLCLLGTDFVSISVQFLKQHRQRHLQLWIMLLQQDCVLHLWGPARWWKEEEFLTSEIWGGKKNPTPQTQNNQI